MPSTFPFHPSAVASHLPSLHFISFLYAFCNIFETLFAFPRWKWLMLRLICEFLLFRCCLCAGPQNFRGWATLSIWLYTQPFACEILLIALVRLQSPSQSRGLRNRQSQYYQVMWLSIFLLFVLVHAFRHIKRTNLII